MRIPMIAAVLVLVGLVFAVKIGGKAQFLVGGGLVKAGYTLQDAEHAFDFVHGDGITPAQVWKELADHNRLAASLQGQLPRATYHPLVAMLVCMDARIDTTELVGDTRRNYYVVRTAGSVLSPEGEDMLELAVENGVKVIVITRHTDCAAEKVAADPAQRARFPALATAVDERADRLQEFLARPGIARRIAAGELLVKEQVIETPTEHLREARWSVGAGL